MEKEDVLFLVDQRGRASNRTGLEGQGTDLVSV
jgi:hypothetical protein